MTEQEYAAFRDGAHGQAAYQTGHGTAIVPIAKGCSFDNVVGCAEPPRFIALSAILGTQGVRLLCETHARALMEIEP